MQGHLYQYPWQGIYWSPQNVWLVSGGDVTVRTLEPPIPKPVFEYIIDPVLKAVLRSPLHRLVSDSLLFITFIGRKSGTEYTAPVGYEQLNGTLYITPSDEPRMVEKSPWRRPGDSAASRLASPR